MNSADDVTKPPEADGSDAIAGLRVGPYRLVCELGRGGMGTVYLAVRSDVPSNRTTLAEARAALASLGKAGSTIPQ